MDLDEAAKALREFAAVVKALRAPGTGCPWDLEQDHRTLRPYLVEEAYEVLDAIDRGDDAALRDELGDLLLQVVLHAQVADDRGAFSLTEVARGITAKMVRRHPHVFGTTKVSGADEVRRNWEQIKAAEGQGPLRASRGPLERLPTALPALLRAQRVAEKLAGTGPDSLAAARNAVRDRLAGLEKGIDARAARERLEQPLGDLLLGLCQLARQLGLSAEDSLRASTQRFADQARGPAGDHATDSPRGP